MQDSREKPRQNLRRGRRAQRGFTHAGALLEGRMQKAGHARGFAQIRLLTHWDEIVGAQIARIARPVKVSYARQGLGGKLTILAKPAHAPELQMQLPRIKERVNACYGYSAISDIRIAQSGTTSGFAEPKNGFTHDRPTPELPPAEAQELRAQVSGVQDEKLRALLESLGKKIKLAPKGPN